MKLMCYDTNGMEYTMAFGIVVYVNNVTLSVAFGFGEFVGGFQSWQRRLKL